MFGQFRQASGDSANSKYAVASLVAALLFWCRPFAIGLLIALVAVNTVYRKSLWCLAHISQKSFKFLPRFTNRYASSTIIGIVHVLWILASFLHAAPDSVSSGFSVARKSTMFDAPLIVPATTRFGILAPQRGACNYNHFSTYAFAIPAKRNMTSGEPFGFCFRDNCELAKWLADERYFSRHDDVSVMFSGGRSASTDARCDNPAFYDSPSQC